jgi:hypothetical protein
LQLYFLSTTLSGSNYESQEYDLVANTVSTKPYDSGSFVGLSEDADNQALWGIGNSTFLWECEAGSTCWTNPTYGTGHWDDATSVAANNAELAGSSMGYLLATNNQSTKSGTGKSHGQTIYCFDPSGTWPGGTWYATAWGASQVTADQDSSNFTVYALDSSGDVWDLTPDTTCTATTGIKSGTTESTTECGTGTGLTFVQIAAKQHVFGLDSSGNVWELQAPGCWSQPATQSFTGASIATDSAGTNGYLVWATDAQGYVWYAN